MSLSDDLFSAYESIKRKHAKSHIESDQSTAYEVFRNNTTAVEVIVKEVSSNTKKAGASHKDTGRKHTQDIDSVKNELFKANHLLEKSRSGFQVCMREMKKQLDSANQREVDLQTKYLNLKLENEKLKTILTSKTNLVKKLSKELNIIKKIIKTVMKSMINIPTVDVNNISYNSDPEYDEFESNLKQGFKFAKFDQSATLDSTGPKEVKATIDKRLFE